MARITFANALAGIRNAFGPGGQQRAKDQFSAVVDGLLQLVGNANIAPGNTEKADPLNSPFTLYVNPYIGSDRFAAGSYNWFEEPAEASTEAIIAAKLRRLENQRLVCGFSPQRPFRTINRAVIEAAIITSKNWYISDPLAHLDCVCIVLAPALHIVYTNPSTDGTAIAVSQWADGFEPTPQHLISFNPAEGGVLLPRGSSLVSQFGDLRHTVLRPSWVPDGVVDEIPTYTNGVATYGLRRQIFLVTGGGYAFGLTFRDKLNLLSTHHLLAAFGHASQAELNAFYAKVWTACGSGGNLSQSYLAARGTEYQIAAPISGLPSESWDSTNSASFYIFQCSVRSDHGMGRLWADGAKVEGFKSFVLANFTGVSLQKGMPAIEGSNQNDMACWQKYSAGNWVPVTSYADYISQSPDNIRPNPLRRSIGVGAINEAFIQKVSIFDIGEAVQSFVDTGGEIDSNNGNSSFGGCAGLARGYRAAALPQDRSWQISAIRVPLSPQEKTGNIQRYYLGSVSAISSSTITLTTELAPHGSNSTVPELLGRRGYSLPAGSYIWIENAQGVDWRAPAAASAWSSSAPTLLNISSAATDPNGNSIGLAGDGTNLAVGSRVYVRRLVDTRSPAERRLSVLLSNTTRARVPPAHYVLQTDITSDSISRTLSSAELILITSTGVGGNPGAGVLTTAEVTLRRGGTPVSYANGTFYRAGTVVLHGNKHWHNSSDLTTQQATPDPALWQETYVHMESGFAPEDNLRNEAPILVFDFDTDGAELTTTCGINWATVWTAAAAIQGQYRTGVDYLGAHLLLTAMGYSPSEAHAALVPRAAGGRNRNPALTSSPASTLALSSVLPAGGAAAAAANWAVEWRRPSTLWMGGHRWFTSGAGNYSKAVPKALQDMGVLNRFTYLFTAQAGGRVIPQGSQEDGLLVSPRGLEDVATGVTQVVENLGSADINTSQSDERAEVSITSLLDLNSALIQGNPVWANGVLPDSSETTQGAVRLATVPETLGSQADSLAISPKTLFAVLGDAIKSVVNLRISLSSSNSVPSANQLDATSIYIHPNNGNEISLYSTLTSRWQVLRFSGVLAFSLSPANAANTNYDIYIYNRGTEQQPDFAINYVAWANDTTPPARGVQDGVVVAASPITISGTTYPGSTRRLIGVVRTTSAGTSTINLGGIYYDSNSADYPRIYLANLYNLYDARAVYFFGTGWNVVQWGPFAPVPNSVYSTTPRVSWVQAGSYMATAFMDIYNNPIETPGGSIAYVAPGIDTISDPPPDAFYGECSYIDTTAGSQWLRALSPGKHDIYYLYKQSASSNINEHLAHGMIVTVKV